MEEGYELDLTYITERIIAVSFPRACSEETYLRNLQDVTRMLQSKHGDSYLIINLSEKRHELSKMNPKTMDTGWLDLHAPPLDKMCTICKAMETWLNANPQHVVVIHCRGGKGRIGVVISSYVHFTNISASADQALDRFAMRRYYDDKVSHLMTPSQKRYVWILNSLLTGSMKMNTSLVFLHHVVLHGVPDFDIGGVCRPYLKVYQGMQAVYTSGIYHISPGYKGKICISLEPAQLLKGDIMIKCYHKSAHAPGREVVFRIQFHTGIIHGCRLTFDKEDLEHASKDPRFPDYGKIELFFSDSPEKMQGCERWQNGPEVVVDYNTADPTVRWDSYENMATDGEVHAQGPLDSSLYAKVRKKSTNRAPPGGPMTGSPEHSDHALSASSDSGLSSASARTGRGPSRHERAALQRLLSGFGLEPPAPPEDMVGQQGTGGLSTCATGGTRRIAAAQVHTNGERETDILDDEAPTHDLHSADSIGTLSSSDGPHSHPLARCTCHQNSQNSLLSDGLVSHVPVSTDLGFSSDDYERGFLPQGSIPGPRAFMVDGYSTQTWVRQQQMVAAQQYAYPITESDVRFPHDKPAPATPPKVPSVVGEGHDSAAGGLGDNNDPDSAPSGDDELASLTVDIDQSIDQLNQLIMDLDPTFVPIPTRSSSVRKDGKSHSNGSASLSANRGGHGPAEDQENVLPTTYAAAAGPACEVEVDQPPSLTQTGRDVVDHEDFRSPGWGLSHRFQDPAFCTPDPQSPEQRAVLYMSDGVDYGRRCEQLVTRAETSGEMVPATPAFPVSPPTPYVKSLMDFSQMRTCGQPGGQYEVYRSPQSESRSYTEIMSHADRSPDNDPFRRDTSGATACQGTFGPARSVTSGSPLLSRTESPTSLIQQSSLSRFTAPYPGASEVLPPTLSCHSSPQGTLRGYGMGLDEADDTDLPSLLGNGGLERSLLAAMEGLSHGGLGGMQPPLPEKRRVSEGEHSLGSGSPALSGFSSPHSGSTISIPFPSVLPDFSTRALATSSPIPDTPARQQVTVKFVQDTSKFWYKPEISRDQAIAILKDKDPGSFIVRDSHSFRGAYGLAMKVATPPPSVLQQSKKVGDLSNELVRHFLIECTQKGVRLKGCPNEPYFGSLTALVCQHSITPLALPCRLIIPDRDPLEDIGEPSAQTAANSAAELLKQGAACNVWFLGSVEMESLTGYQAVQKATSMILSMEPPPISTVVHFKVSAQGITLTDNQRKLFFRRHYAVNTVIFCALDPQNRKWTRDGVTSAKIFGFVARKTGSSTENVCHVFAEHDPEQPASAIVNFVSKVMIGSQKNK